MQGVNQRLRPVFDRVAVAYVWLSAPLLRTIARRRLSLPHFQRFADRAGFQLRSDHYYEPTYNDTDLPDDVTAERPLPGIDLNGAAQLALLEKLDYGAELEKLPLHPKPGQFGYINRMYGFGDAELYYSIIRHKKPQRIIEVGSGNLTLVALEAIAANKRDDPSYECDFACIEPYEMPWLEKTGVRVIRERVEHVPLTVFDALGEDDILFIDSSHVIRPYGDVLHEFQQIVPRLSAGVWVQVHDIFTPRDYPEKWLRQHRRLWNEQYLLESFLAFNSRFDVICAANWLKHNHFSAIARVCPMLGRHPEAEPGAFWFVAR